MKAPDIIDVLSASCVVPQAAHVRQSLYAGSLAADRSELSAFGLPASGSALG
jgi:hypothetical protein